MTTPWGAMSKETAYVIHIENKRRSLKRVSFRMNITNCQLKTRQECSETLLWSYINCITSIRENPIIWYIKWKLRLFSSWWWSENDVLRKCKFLIYITTKSFFCKVSRRGMPYPIVSPLGSIYYISKISVPSLYWCSGYELPRISKSRRHLL